MSDDASFYKMESLVLMSDSSDNDEDDNKPQENNAFVKAVNKKQADPVANSTTNVSPTTEKADAEIAEILDALLLELPEVNEKKNNKRNRIF